jgi:hypothetical protein
MTLPRFKLFKNANRATPGEYVGSLAFPAGHPAFPKGRVFILGANVAEHDKADGTGAKGKHFEGTLTGGQDLIRDEKVKSMLKGATVTGDPSAIPQDLLAQVELHPFDDSAELAKAAP